VLLRLLCLRLRRLLRLRLRRLLPLPEWSVVPVWAGAICVNFAILFASCFVNLYQPCEPYDAAGTLGGH
jgi:hypothetical protein